MSDDTQPSRIPFDYLDKVCLAASSRERGISSAPVWQLHIEGDFDEAIARAAVGALARRYPILVSRVVSDEPGKPVRGARRISYQPDALPDLDQLFTVVDLSDAGEERFQQVQQQQFNHFIIMKSGKPGI